jgi:hypothetical protein
MGASRREPHDGYGSPVVLWRYKYPHKINNRGSRSRVQEYIIYLQ